MRKIGIIGLGNVGITVAYTLFTRGVADELVLIDPKSKKVRAEENDLKDALSCNHFHTKVINGDYDQLANADVLITAFGDIKATARTDDRFAEFPINVEQAKIVGPKVKASGFKGIWINISNPCDAITTILKKTSDFPKNRIFGTGTLLDTSRMKRQVADYLGNQDPKNIGGYVLGEHGNSQFTAWSTVSVGIRPLSKYINDSLKYKRLEENARQGAFEVISGKGYTSYAIATCAVRLIEAVFADAHTIFPVSVYLESLDTYIGYPAVVGANGIEHVEDISLTTAEKESLSKSADYIKGNLAKVGY
ncbi:MAG: L-lactate dehydrogenase [Liquorilactobacillus ghanensis]|uniref:L-lactate dehydrogenase n=1 Tax=Liquorilactobacillus ghanensis TaxID=399370 RepID=UPI0039EB48D4